MKKRILVTGFQPFGGQTINPSWEAVRRLPSELGPWEVRTLCLPVEYGRGADLAWEAALACGAEAVLAVGQAGGRCALTPEKIAINLRDSRQPDGAGRILEDSPILPHGPDGLFSTLPVKEMVRAMRAAEVPAALSCSAGTYVCNDVMYTLLSRGRETGLRAGFLHLPYLPQQTRGEEPSLPLDVMVRGLRAAILAIEQGDMGKITD